MNKLSFIVLFVVWLAIQSSTLVANPTKPFKLFGDTNYSQQENKRLTTTFNGEYSLVVYEPRHKLYVLYLGGKVVLDLDHFGNETKTNVFTTFGVDF